MTVDAKEFSGVIDAIMHEKIMDYMNSAWKDIKCPLCLKIQWVVPNTFYELRQYHRGNIQRITGRTAIIPVVPVTCARCGYTILINSIASGLTNKDLNND